MISIAAQFMAKHGEEITFSTGVTDPPWSLAGDGCSSCDMHVDTEMEKPHKRNFSLKYHSIRKEAPSITLKGWQKRNMANTYAICLSFQTTEAMLAWYMMEQTQVTHRNPSDLTWVRRESHDQGSEHWELLQLECFCYQSKEGVLRLLLGLTFFLGTC